MLITGARVAINSAQAAHLDLWIRDGLISFSPVPLVRSHTLDLKNFLVLPGLINAHDHLELNLFPKLGRGPYPNASVWAEDIYHPDEAPIKQHLAVPKSLRLLWGAIKNLLSGVTTVAHHNAFDPLFLDPRFPVRVVRRYGWAHSIKFSSDWKARLKSTPAHYPFVIHAAEGTDGTARLEVQTLAQAGALNRSTVLVHAVGVNRSDLRTLERADCGIVWCPSSNHFILQQSLEEFVLESATRLALGNDSAITAEGDLLDEMRVAHRSVDAHRLYRMVTSVPAAMFKLASGFGRIRQGGPADLLVMSDTGCTPAMTLLQNYPKLVIVRGRIRLVSSELALLCPATTLQNLRPFRVEGRGTYLISANVPSILNQTTRILQEPVRLAGKAIAA